MEHHFISTWKVDIRLGNNEEVTYHLKEFDSAKYFMETMVTLRKATLRDAGLRFEDRGNEGFSKEIPVATKLMWYEYFSNGSQVCYKDYFSCSKWSYSLDVIEGMDSLPVVDEVLCLPVRKRT